MNLVFLAPFAYAPKATVSARMLPMAAALVRRGHAVTLLIPPYDGPADSARAWTDQGVRLENLRLPQSPIPTYRLLALSRGLARRTRQLRPDIVHVFKPIGPAALAMWLLHQSKISNLQSPVLVDNDDWEGPGGWLDVNPYPALQKRVMAWQEVWCLRHARAVTCASNALHERTQSITGGSTPILTLPNGPANPLREQVARAEAQREELRARFGWTALPIAIYSGTVPFGHDMDIAVRAVRDALSRHPDLKWVIVATGDGLPSLRAAIDQAGITAAVEWHGFMPHEQLVERLVAADVALYPYRDSNINRAKCSGKVIDYMACARPMVVSDVGMNRVYIEDNRSGLLTPPGDGEAFSAALCALLDAPTHAARLGRAAQQRLWERFSWEDRIVELEALYESLTQPAARASHS
jgi:glycosyltransferase involved in cell wall biosynthesis